VFSSKDSYNYVETYLEKTVGQSDDILREDVPIVLVLAQDPKEKEMQEELKSKAQELVNRYTVNLLCKMDRSKNFGIMKIH
jgi:thiamine monophosphate synthase